METMNYLKTSGLDIIVLILYFCVLVGNGIYFSYKKAKELKKVKGDTEAENSFLSAVNPSEFSPPFVHKALR